MKKITTFLTAVLFCLCLSFSIRVNAENAIPDDNYIALEEMVFENPKDLEKLSLYFYNCPNLKDIYIHTMCQITLTNIKLKTLSKIRI